MLYQPVQHSRFNSIAEAIKHYREKRKWTQQQLADRLEVCQATIAHWEKGRVIPPTKQMQRLSRELSAPIQALMEFRWKVL